MFSNTTNTNTVSISIASILHKITKKIVVIYKQSQKSAFPLFRGKNGKHLMKLKLNSKVNTNYIQKFINMIVGHGYLILLNLLVFSYVNLI